MSCFIIIPYLRRKSDLITAWNAMLGGIAVYVGIGALEAASTDVGGVFPLLSWYHPTKDEVRWYMTSSTVFIVALLVSHYYIPFTRSVANRSLRKWPEFTSGVLFYVLLVCAAFIFVDNFTRGMTFFGPLVNNVSRKAWVVASAFTFVYWYFRRDNLFALGLFVLVFILAALNSMVVYTGRRMILGVILGPLLTVYWITLRNWDLKKSIVALSVAGAAVFFVAAAYSTFRHYSISDDSKTRNVREIVDQITSFDSNRIGRLLGKGPLRFFAQSNAHYGMLLKRMLDEKRVDPKPANTLAFLISYPIPRRVWPGKPFSVGVMYPTIVGLPNKTNFGVGISGHGAFEGGLPILVLYGFLVAFGVSFLDVPLANQPSNPFLLSIMAASLPHVVGFCRGDLTHMTIEVLIGFIVVVPLGIGGRMLFGTARSAPQELAHRVPAGYQRRALTR
jgi:hypothetical protein